MPTDASVFDGRLARWNEEMQAPWARLKYELGRANLARHLPSSPLRILDAGGGNGLDAIPLAAAGHAVDIVDYSQEMLADVPLQIARLNAPVTIATHHANLLEVARLFAPATFDLVLCHNIIQYIDAVPAFLADLVALLRPGGRISVISINRFSIPYHAAFLDGDLAGALAQLDTHTARAKIFDTTMRSYSAAELKQLLEGAGLFVEGDYGIRCLCDYWGDNERKADPVVFRQIEALEYALTDRSPYKLLARYAQVVARK